jgi:hypothetical protein
MKTERWILITHWIVGLAVAVAIGAGLPEILVAPEGAPDR